jgi:DNA polymerase III alpha subunit
MRIRTGYSFKTAVGHLEEVADRLVEIGWRVGPMSDRASTFGYVSWTKICRERGLRPVYGVELPVTADLAAKKPPLDWWTFFATKHIRPLNELVERATAAGGLTYDQAQAAAGLIKITGERVLLANLRKGAKDVYVSLSPSTPRGVYNEAVRRRLPLVATGDNFYTGPGDREFYRVALGPHRASTQTYPQHILSDDELRSVLGWADSAILRSAFTNRDSAMARCVATLGRAALLHPKRNATLRELCEEGGESLGCDLTDPVYAERLDRELRLIAEKDFEDYFFIIGDLMQWSRDHMVVGPARGSSCGSLVCYLLGITSIDPIPYGLIFERFIDTTRSDLPDIDLDFSDERRHMAMEYVVSKYGREHTARLGSVGMFQAKSALKATATALRIPMWQETEVNNTIIKRSFGDSRSDSTVIDTLTETDVGRRMLRDFPAATIAGRLENHPSAAGQHAAGMLLTEEPVVNFVAIDGRSGVAMCDKYDAETYNLLKIDMLGLTQLSVFERTLELVGEEPRNEFLEAIPLDDQAAFDVLNKLKFSGVFQFQYPGSALQTLLIKFVKNEGGRVDHLEDIVAFTALCRPGPLGSGMTDTWMRRRAGNERIAYPHPILEPYLRDTMGVPIYQENIMQIGKDVGDLTWEEVTLLRKAMSKSLGKEYFDKIAGDKWRAGAISRGIPKKIADAFWDSMCQFGMWCLSGDTVLINPHPNKSLGRTITLRDLYESGGASNSQRPERRQKLLCLQDGRIKPASVVEVYYSGQRETWEVEVESGEKIRSTMEHRFLCSDGKYRPLKKLVSGASVAMLGSRPLTIRKTKKGTGSGGHNWWPKLASGTPIYKRNVARLKSLYKRCQKCLVNPYQETHHIDGDHENNAWENLQPLCRSCHRSMHHAGYRPHSQGREVRYSKIVSISDPRVEDTYDVAMPTPHNNFVANGFVVHNSFNRSHSVAYAMVTYWSCWLKAHHPVEFAAATLDAEADPDKQVVILREMRDEGVDYIPVDPDVSSDRWEIKTVAKKKLLVGPLTNIRNIGPAAVTAILDSRKLGTDLRPSIIKRLASARTSIESLSPIADEIRRLHPKIESILASPVTPIAEIEGGREVLILGVVTKVAPLNENEPARVARRQGRTFSDPVEALNLFFKDDTGEIFAKIGRFEFGFMGRPVVAQAKRGKSLYAVRGWVPSDFRMIRIQKLRFLGNVGDGT